MVVGCDGVMGRRGGRGEGKGERGKCKRGRCWWFRAWWQEKKIVAEGFLYVETVVNAGIDLQRDDFEPVL